MSKQQVDLQHQANVIRKLTLEEIGKLGVRHVDGSFSICEVLVALYFRLMKIGSYNPGWSERNRLVLSKGYGGLAPYAALALKGYFPTELLDTLSRPGTILPSHCDMRHIVGIDMTTGPLGQSSSATVGMVFVVQMDHLLSTTYTIIGDGENDEDQIWKAAMFAGDRRSDHLIVSTDHNKTQIDGYMQETNLLEPLEDRWRAFGWHVQSIDGHNTDEIVSAMEQTKRAQGESSMILPNTIKGKGASFSKGKLALHNMKLIGETWKAAVTELEKEGA